MNGPAMDPKQLKKRMEDQFNTARKTLIDSIPEAIEILGKWKMDDGPSVIALAQILFSMKMQKKQGIARIEQMIAMAKAQENTKKVCDGPCEHESCNECGP